ncbi:hypothetical protein CPC08DRAFT_717857 [Agrocybe pediades]|nr:hypothetical protein CPC08DRAFT_717857 [Agrocybe pediades]
MTALVHSVVPSFFFFSVLQQPNEKSSEKRHKWQAPASGLLDSFKAQMLKDEQKLVAGEHKLFIAQVTELSGNPLFLPERKVANAAMPARDTENQETDTLTYAGGVFDKDDQADIVVGPSKGTDMTKVSPHHSTCPSSVCFFH